MKIIYRTTGKVYGLVESQDDLDNLIRLSAKKVNGLATTDLDKPLKRTYTRKNGRKAWSKEEEERLFSVMTDGTKPNKTKQLQLSREFKRTLHAIRIRWDRVKNKSVKTEEPINVI